MLAWLFKLFEPQPTAERSVPRVVQSGLRVASDERGVRLTEPGGEMLELTWASLGRVDVRATLSDAAELTLFWILSPRDSRPSLVIPMDADGEHDFVRAMQVRLHGFDNMAVVEAMSARANAEYQIWPPGD